MLSLPVIFWSDIAFQFVWFPLIHFTKIDDDVMKWKHFCVTGPLCGEFPAQRPVTRSFDVLFDLRLNKRLSKQLWGWWFETPSSPLWYHCNASPNKSVGHKVSLYTRKHFLCGPVTVKYGMPLGNNEALGTIDIYSWLEYSFRKLPWRIWVTLSQNIPNNSLQCNTRN